MDLAAGDHAQGQSASGPTPPAAWGESLASQLVGGLGLSDGEFDMMMQDIDRCMGLHSVSRSPSRFAPGSTHTNPPPRSDH